MAIASTVWATTAPPRSATSRVLDARSLACLAFSAFFLTVAVISSIDAEVCSRLAACSSVRCDRSVVLVEISAEALLTSLAEILMLPMVAPTRSATISAAFEISPISSLRSRPSSLILKSPSASLFNSVTRRLIGLTMFVCTKRKASANTAAIDAAIEP